MIIYSWKNDPLLWSFLYILCSAISRIHYPYKSCIQSHDFKDEAIIIILGDSRVTQLTYKRL